jgi:hypothetical protein
MNFKFNTKDFIIDGSGDNYLRGNIIRRRDTFSLGYADFRVATTSAEAGNPLSFGMAVMSEIERSLNIAEAYRAVPPVLAPSVATAPLDNTGTRRIISPNGDKLIIQIDEVVTPHTAAFIAETILHFAKGCRK